jgi:hypothetical protein
LPISIFPANIGSEHPKSSTEQEKLSPKFQPLSAASGRHANPSLPLESILRKAANSAAFFPKRNITPLPEPSP